jgi:hypothetical protein
VSTADRRAREKARRRREILAAARQEFFERGFRTELGEFHAADPWQAAGSVWA